MLAREILSLGLRVHEVRGRGRAEVRARPGCEQSQGDQQAAHGALHQTTTAPFRPIPFIVIGDTASIAGRPRSVSLRTASTLDRRIALSPASTGLPFLRVSV